MIRLGFEGYKKVMTNCVANAKALSEAIEKLGRFKLLSKPVGVPLVAFALLDDSDHDEHEIAEGLRRYGWTVPAYTMAPDAQSVTLLRVVVREDFSHGLVDRLVTDIKRVLAMLDKRPSQHPHPSPSPKHVEPATGAPPHTPTGGEKRHKSRKHRHAEANRLAHLHEQEHGHEKEKVSVFSEEHNKQGHFNVNKPHGLRKSNGVC